MSQWNCFLYHNLTKLQGGAVGLGHDVDFLLFEKQVVNLKRDFDVVSVKDAVMALKEGRKGKFATIWFDDGYKSVLDIGLPILNKHGLTAAISICSSFYRHEKVFWRKKIDYIVRSGRAKQFVSFLKNKGGYDSWVAADLMKQSLDHFSLDFINCMEDFSKLDNLNAIDHAIHLQFCDKEEIRRLKLSGWELANHSLHHYPITESSGFDLIEEEFNINDRHINEDFGCSSNLNVAPFSRLGKIDKCVPEYAKGSKAEDKFLVLVEERSNSVRNLEEGIIYRRTARVC